MSIKSPHHHLQQLLFILVYGIISLVLKYMCFVSADSTEIVKYQKTYPYTPSNSTVHSDFHTWCIFSCELDYTTFFKNNLHVFCFCKVVLQEQKHIQGYLVLTENIYPRRSEIGC